MDEGLYIYATTIQGCGGGEKMTDYEYSAEECDFDEIDCDEEECWVKCGDDWVPLSDVVTDDEDDDEIEEQG